MVDWGVISVAIPPRAFAGEIDMRSPRVRIGLLIGASFLALLSSATTALAQRTFDETVRNARAVIVGTLTKATPRWGNASRTWLETEYEFAVDDAIVADDRVRTGKTITITRWGGELGGRRQLIAGDPRLVKGNRYVVLLNEKYSDPECRQPLVGRSDGLLAVVKSNGAEMVVDHRGEPVVLVENRLVRFSDLAGRKLIPEPVTAALFAKSLKADLARIQALPKAQRATTARSGEARSRHRPLTKLSGQRDVANLPKMLPKGSVVKGVHEPTPRSTRSVHLAQAKAATHRAARHEIAANFSGEVAKLPLAFNQLPADFDMAGVDVNCMVLWNHYFPGTFKIYSEPLDDVGANNGVSDIWGFVTDDELQDILGIGFNGSPYWTTWWVNADSGQIEEADIFFNAQYDWTLDDAGVYNGADNRISFRRMMMQALGWSVGLSLSGNLAVMSTSEPAWFEGINQPQGDDIWGLDQLYPRSAGENPDLLITLASSPQDSQWVEASFSPTAKAGGEITVGGYLLCNVGVGTAKLPTVGWYLCSAQNWDDRVVHLGNTTYSPLDRGSWFIVNENIVQTLAVPQDIPPGEYYLAAFIPDESNFGLQGFFPHSTNSSFSRSNITITKD